MCRFTYESIKEMCVTLLTTEYYINAKWLFVPTPLVSFHMVARQLSTQPGTGNVKTWQWKRSPDPTRNAAWRLIKPICHKLVMVKWQELLHILNNLTISNYNFLHYSGTTRSTLWLLMDWLLESPNHWQQNGSVISPHTLLGICLLIYAEIKANPS